LPQAGSPVKRAVKAVKKTSVVIPKQMKKTIIKKVWVRLWA
jgi:hypothetical protein